MPTDAERIDFLAEWSRRSRTGVSVEWSPEDQFRLMTFHQIDAGQPNIREAIDAAMALRAPR